MPYEADPGRIARKENQAFLTKLDSEADAAIPKVAAAWSAGLLAIIAAMGAAAWVGGPALIASIDNPFRTIVLCCSAVGLLLLVVALALLLRASAGKLGVLKAADFDADSTVRMHIAAVRRDNIQRIEAGRWVGLVAIGFVVLAVLSSMVGWRAEARLTVETADEAVCGVVQSSDGQVLVLEIAGKAKPTTIEFKDIVTLTPSGAC
jgi:hypothetical protein